MNRVRTLPLLLLTALLAVGALAGTASAAKLITGKDIKNNSVTGADLKTGTVTGSDLKNGSVGQGDLAPSARTQVFFDDNDGAGVTLPTWSDTGLGSCSAAASIPGRPGTFLVTATGVIDNKAGTAPSITNRCGIVRGDLTHGDVRFALAAQGEPAETTSFSLQRLITSTDSTPITVRCTEMGGEDLQLTQIAISAVRVSKG